MSRILITGASGQLGTELTEELRIRYGNDRVVASDIVEPEESREEGPFEKLDVLDFEHMKELVETYEVNQIYHLAALLSAKAEKKMRTAWNLNMEGLLNVLNLAVDKSLDRIYWPSSIAVFGPDAETKKTPQNTALNPTTVYGISKVAGEQWCSYYHSRYGVDVRSLRYPGLIGYKSLPGGGTTDYAVEIYHKALAGERFECFLKEDTYLPMMYMKDAIKATLDLMDANAGKVNIRTSYNISAISFTPKEIENSIQKIIPELQVHYNPDYRQNIADSWPDSIDDSAARSDWGWEHQYDLDKMTADIMNHLPEYKEDQLTNP